MPRLPAAAVLLATAALAACTPTFDWREVRIPSTPSKAMLACKPHSGPGAEVLQASFDGRGVA